MDKEILTIADVSALLSLPEGEIAQLLADGDLPGRQIGPHWYVSRQRLLQYIANAKPPPPPVSPPPAKSLPAKVLGPNWRCEKCQEIYPPDVVECAGCGTVRNTPLIGFRLPRAGMGSGTNLGKEIN